MLVADTLNGSLLLQSGPGFGVVFHVMIPNLPTACAEVIGGE
jgi:hypothetical protein